MGRARLAIATFIAVTLASLPAHATFHLWQIKEVFTNSSGSIQYIELFSPAAGQTFLAGHTITVSDGTTTHTFTFPTNLSGDTTNKHLLIATPGFQNIPGAPTPDYVLPCGAFFDPSWTTITINFGSNADVESIISSQLPKDGVNSLTDSVLSGSNTASWSSGPNSPTNIMGSTGPATLTAGQKAGTSDACDDGQFCNGTEACNVSGCAAGTPPCTQQCIEATDTCVECINNGNCNDGNPCTDDVCNGSNVCEHTPHVGSCDDGLFCNGADTCSATTCVHAGDPCGGQNCNEGRDTCGSCAGPADCEDGEPCTLDTCDSGVCNRATATEGSPCDNDTTFCNGVGTCTAGVCGAIAAPCDPVTAVCNETSRICSPNDPLPDAGTVTPGDDAGTGNGNKGGGGCCQASTSAGTFTGPALVLVLGMVAGRRRRRTT